MKKNNFYVYISNLLLKIENKIHIKQLLNKPADFFFFWILSLNFSTKHTFFYSKSIIFLLAIYYFYFFII